MAVKGEWEKLRFAQILAQLFAQDGFDVLAIDSDPNTNLAMAFGIKPEEKIEPLINMKELIAERTGTEKDAIGSYFRLNPNVSDLPEKYWLKINNIKLLVLGAITHAGAGCACPEGAFLKAMLRHTILQRKELVIVDLAAGVEFMGRASVQGIDMLMLVVEPGERSIETANRMGEMANELGIKHVGAIANKITSSNQVDLIRDKMKNISLLAALNYSSFLQEADMKLNPVFDADKEVLTKLEDAKGQILELLRNV